MSEHEKAFVKGLNVGQVVAEAMQAYFKLDGVCPACFLNGLYTGIAAQSAQAGFLSPVDIEKALQHVFESVLVILSPPEKEADPMSPPEFPDKRKLN